MTMTKGIKDKVVILGMGCSRFGERWDASEEDLILEAYRECIADAAIDPREIQAAWFASALDQINVGKSAVPLAVALRLNYIPVTRVENLCASGSEALRGAVYAVASGACDFALAMGAEKLKDTGYGGLPRPERGTMQPLWMPNISAPGSFAQLAGAYVAKYGKDASEVKRAMAQISVKSHENGVKNPKAHLQKPISVEQVLAAPIVAAPLGIFDCCGVSDGAACAIVTTPEIARSLGKQNLVSVKALQIAVSNGTESGHNSWDGSYFATTRVASKRAYEEAGIRNPREELSMIEVHDCFSITELVTMEDLHISPPGAAVNDVMDGFYNAEGKVPCQIDGGLKCFGHPIGASGLRMIYEVYLQLQERAGPRQLRNPRFGLTHNLGGVPIQNVCSIAILGHLGA
jgi:acetyl-CoA C-acetyltransferase